MQLCQQICSFSFPQHPVQIESAKIVNTFRDEFVLYVKISTRNSRLSVGISLLKDQDALSISLLRTTRRCMETHITETFRLHRLVICPLGGDLIETPYMNYAVVCPAFR